MLEQSYSALQPTRRIVKGQQQTLEKNNACQELERTKWALEIHDDIG
jgi:hypothetical protein